MASHWETGKGWIIRLRSAYTIMLLTHLKWKGGRCCRQKQHRRRRKGSGSGKCSGGSRGKVCVIWRADVTEALTAALPGVAFVVGNKHGAAHTGGPGCVHGRRKGKRPQQHCPSERDVVAAYDQHPKRLKTSRERAEGRVGNISRQPAEKSRRQHGVVAML